MQVLPAMVCLPPKTTGNAAPSVLVATLAPAPMGAVIAPSTLPLIFEPCAGSPLALYTAGALDLTASLPSCANSPSRPLLLCYAFCIWCRPSSVL